MEVSNRRDEVEEFFDSMDRDYDGRLSFEEFMGEESPIEKLFKNMDKNGDGLVTKQVSNRLVYRRLELFIVRTFLFPFHQLQLTALLIQVPISEPKWMMV